MVPKQGQRLEHVARALYYLGVVAISAVAILIVTMALAEPHEADGASAPLPAPTQDTDHGLEEVIVTAEKLGRSLMQTPTSTVVIDRHELERRAGLTTTRDLLETIPNVVLGGTGNTAPVIRGIDGTGAAQGADAFFAGSRPRLKAPRVGFGLGLFATSSVAYVDLVNTFTITSGGSLGMFPCKNHQLVSTVNAGIDTQIAFPLEGWAKILNTPVTDTLDKISKAASVRQQVFKKEWYRTEPDIKACHIG